MDTNADGSVVLGYLEPGGYCLWVGRKLAKRLFSPPGSSAYGEDLSSDGGFVLGQGDLQGMIGDQFTDGYVGVLWRRSGAACLISELLFSNGLPPGLPGTTVAGSYPFLSSGGLGSDAESLTLLGSFQTAVPPSGPAKSQLYLATIPRPEPPQPDVPLELGTLFQKAGTLKPSAKFTETYAESLVRVKNVTLLEKQGKGTWTSTLSVSLVGVDIATFTTATPLKISVGDFDFNATLGGDPKWKVGKKSVVLPIQQESASGVFTKVGTVKMSWSAKSATITVSCDAAKMPLCHPHHALWRGPLEQTFLARVELGSSFGVMAEIPGKGTGIRTIKSRGINPGVGEVFAGLNKVVMSGTKKAP